MVCCVVIFAFTFAESPVMLFYSHFAWLESNVLFFQIAHLFQVKTVQNCAQWLNSRMLQVTYS